MPGDSKAPVVLLYALLGTASPEAKPALSDSAATDSSGRRGRPLQAAGWATPLSTREDTQLRMMHELKPHTKVTHANSAIRLMLGHRTGKQGKFALG